MDTKKIAALLAGAALIAGCSTSSDSNDTTAAANGQSLLQAVADASGSDDKALEAWQALLETTLETYSYSFHVEGEGEDYLYKENSSGTMVKDNFIYDIARDDIFITSGQTAYCADLTDIDDSYDDLETGYGTIDRYGSDAAYSAVSLSDTSGSVLKGSVLNTDAPSATDLDQAALDNLIDNITCFGYVRTIDPIHNASYYTFEIKQDGDDWELEVTMKDTTAVKSAAASKALLFDNRTNRPVLGLDEVESETYTFTFDSDGVLKEVDNDIYHVLSAVSTKYSDTYLNISNTASISSASASDLSQSSMDDYFSKILAGSLKAGSEFSIENWK